MATRKTATPSPARPPAKTTKRPKPAPARRVAPKPAATPVAARVDVPLTSQMTSAAIGLLSLGKGAVDAARGLQIASSAARVLGSGSPTKAAKMLLGVIGGVGAVSGAARGATRAGSILKGLRESAGLTIDEVSKAIDLKDPDLLDAMERGKIALPFELILRLAAVVGRNDPVGFIMKLTRSANPELWQGLEALGIGRLVLQTAREREFANIYRGDDSARKLSDEDFAALLAFVKASFEIAMAFRGRQV